MSTTPEPQPALRCIDLLKQFTDGPRSVVAVDHVHLSVPAGALVVITGPSGSGKTTLLELLGGLLEPDAGSIWIGGTALNGTSARERALLRRSGISYVFQAGNLLPMISVYENVTLALALAGLPPVEIHQRAARALEATGLSDRAHQLPSSLSAGERQRAAVARALAKRPNVMLLDEPTANLDRESARQTFELLRNLCLEHRRAAIVATHDPAATSFADLHYTLTDGTLAEASRS